MAFPESYKSKILPALITYLEAESASAAEPSLDGDITWTFNSNVHLPSMNPKGLAYLVSANPAATTTTGLIHEEVRIRLRLLVSKSVEASVRDAADNDTLLALDEVLRADIETELINAEEFLKASLYKVKTQGAVKVTLGLKDRVVLAGHRLAGAPQRIVTTMDRQGRATGALIMDILWNDGGLFASQYSHA